MELAHLKNGLICALDQATFRELAPHFHRRLFQRGEVIQEPDTPVERVHFPNSGVLSVVSVMRDGSAIETSTVGRESAVGLLAGLAPLQAFSRVIGQTPGELYSLDAERFRRAAAMSASLRDAIIRHCDALLAGAQQSIACNALHDVEERFCRWLLTCHDRSDGDEIGVTQEFLAMMLGVQRTTVTQVAGLLQEAGLIRYQRGRVTIVDRQALEQRTCECYDAVRSHAEQVLPETPAANGPCVG